MKLYNKFPIEVGKYRNLKAYNMNSFLNYVNKWNNKIDIYSSIYSYSNIRHYIPEERYKSAQIDKIMWDIDPHYYDYSLNKKVYIGKISERALALSDSLLENDIKHIILTTGGGIHIYASANTYTLVNYIKKPIHKKICRAYDTQFIQSDAGLHGDIARISRVPRTRNMKFTKSKGYRYCVYITRNDLENDERWIKKSNSNINQFKVYGKKDIDLEYWEDQMDVKRYKNNDNIQYDISDIKEITIDVELDTNIDKIDYWCVKNSINRCNKLTEFTNRDRYIVMSYLLNFGYDIHEAATFLKKYFNDTNFNKAMIEGSLKHIYKKQPLFPSKDNLHSLNRCNDCNMC